MSELEVETSNRVAVIGAGVRVSGAEDPETLWRRLAAGEVLTKTLSDEEFLARGGCPEKLSDDALVRVVSEPGDLEAFDAALFKMTPAEGRILDPQHRLLLECTQRCFDHAGYDPSRLGDAEVGVFVGVGAPGYLLHNLWGSATMSDMGQNSVFFSNDKGFAATRVSHRFNFRGPSMTVDTACSSSLSAIHQAFRSLLSYDCDLAVAGGASVVFPRWGYMHSRDGIRSSDGRCRPFDANGDGTIFGSGGGLVLLKRLEDAVADDDAIIAVLCGSAMNNDGSDKAGFTAPSASGQARVVSEALAFADLSPSDITYVEAHGTGTPIGDPIEVQGLNAAFVEGTEHPGCALGATKSNLGHLDTAAGAIGMIKTAYAVSRGVLPPLAEFNEANARARLNDGPFYIPTSAQAWEASPRRAGVSALGIGGTNVHVLLEEAPQRVERAAVPHGPFVLSLSAHDERALEEMTDALASHLEDEGHASLGDIAFTLREGRREFPYRRALVASDHGEAVAKLRGNSSQSIRAKAHVGTSVAYMVPGQGCFKAGMLGELYEHERQFRQAIQACDAAFRFRSDVRLSSIFERDGARFASLLESDAELLQVVSFSACWGVAAMWKDRGLEPSALVGHSLGEYVAATLAGVFSLDAAIRIVATRGRLMAQCPEGTMLAVSAPQHEIQRRLGPHVDLAAINGDSQCVLSGLRGDLESEARALAVDGIESRWLRADHAFHSRAMGRCVDPLEQAVRKESPKAPEIPIASCVTGKWLTDQEATDPSYWAQHIARTVDFHGALGTVSENNRVLLEVGPGQVLSSVARMSAAGRNVILSSCRRVKDDSGESDRVQFLTAAASLWCEGVGSSLNELDFEGGRRVHLPGLAFRRRQYWVGAGELLKEVRDEASEELTRKGASAGSADSMRTRLAALWTTLLGTSDVDDSSGFFDQGGNSLVAAQLATRVRELFKVDVSVRTVLQAQTFGATLRAIEEANGSADVSPIEAFDRSQPRPVSSAQQALWFSEQLAGPSPTYNIPGAIRLRGDLDVEALRRALSEIVARHEVLRSSFQDVDGSPQAVLSRDGFDVLSVESVKEADFSARAREFALSHFDVASGPLFRAQLMRFQSTDHVLLVNMHHIVADGWSLGVLVAEMIAAYRSFSQGTEPDLPPLNLQYVDYAAWQRQEIERGAFDKQHAFWKEKLSGIDAISSLPTDHSGGKPGQIENRLVRFSLEKKHTERVHELARETGATPFIILLTAFELAVLSQTGRTDVIVGTTSGNREQTVLESMIGLFVNNLPLRTDWGGNPTLQEALSRVCQTSLDAFSHQNVPFIEVVRRSAMPRTRGRTPVFQLLFVLQQLEQHFELPGLSATTVELDDIHTKFDVSLFMEEKRGVFTAALAYNSRLFDAERMTRLEAEFKASVELILSEQKLHVSDALAKIRHPKPTARRRVRSIRSARSAARIRKCPQAPSIPMMTPAQPGADLLGWLVTNRPAVDERLHQAGAILFRGFGTSDVGFFEAFGRAVCNELYSDYGDLPPEPDSKAVYGATPYPADAEIFFHNESSHLRRWPLRQMFQCHIRAEEGGQTPLVDVRTIAEGMHDEMRRAFENRGLRYVRNFIPSLDVSWQRFFGTSERSTVEERCREQSMGFRWVGDDGLQTWIQRPAFERHPRTQEMCFFNQIALHHPSCVDPQTRGALEELYGRDGLPRDVRFGDSEPIPDEWVNSLRAQMGEASVQFDWLPGDILLLDNMLVAHSRRPYVGDRKIVVAMGDMLSENDLRPGTAMCAARR